MPDYLEIAQGLVEYGYLDEADLETAADLLADTLVLEEDTRNEAILEAEARADTIVATDDVPFETIYQVEVHDDVMNMSGDAEIMAASNVIATLPFVNAANAMLAADLIDAVNTEAIASLIATFWTDEYG